MTEEENAPECVLAVRPLTEPLCQALDTFLLGSPLELPPRGGSLLFPKNRITPASELETGDLNLEPVLSSLTDYTHCISKCRVGGRNTVAQPIPV